MRNHIGRRGFITLLGGAAAAWPLAARAQQAAMPVIGLLLPGSASNERPVLRGFLSGLRQAGFVDGQNMRIEYRYVGDKYEQFPSLVADLVQRRVDVIVAQARALPAAREATSTIPIVFIGGGDPVRNGFVASLNRPGGNITGVTLLGPDIASKYLGLLHDAVPQVKTIGILLDPTPQSSGNFQEMATQAAARGIGVSIHAVRVSNGSLDAAFAALLREGVGALITPASTYFYGVLDQLATLAVRSRLAAISPYREFVEAGGLMSYGPSVVETYRLGGLYAGRVLKGTKPADLPVMQPTKFEFLINLKTMKALGLTIPPGVLAIVDEVIE